MGDSGGSIALGWLFFNPVATIRKMKLRVKSGSFGKRTFGSLLLGCTLLFLAVFSALFLVYLVLFKIQSRHEYQSVIPYLVVLMLVGGTWTWWPSSRFAGWAKHVARGLIYTLLFAPVLIGPEGSYVPLVVSLPFLLVSPSGMLDLLASHPCELLLSFACAVCLSMSIGMLRLALTAKPAPAPESTDSGKGRR